VTAERTRGSSSTARGTELDAERELDLARFWWAIVARWWLVVLSVAVGILVGYLVSLGGGRVFRSTATVYLGQPLSPNANTQVQGLQTNPSTVGQIVKSESVVRAVAAAVGVDPDELRAGISSRAVTGAVTRVGQTQLVEVSVRGPWRRQSADAANLLADQVVDRVSAYPNAKIDLLETQLTDAQSQLETIDEAIQRYREAADDQSLSATERLLAIGLLSNAEEERGRLLDQVTQASLAVALARDVEHARVVTRGSASKVAARGRSSSLIVGAIIGLLVGVLLALIWDPVRARLGKSRALAAE
jgi:capsular polysaccharide biosynthesis protein